MDRQSLLAYADDIAIFHSESITEIVKVRKALQELEREWSLSLNEKKSLIMTSSKQWNQLLRSKQYPTCDTYKYLGVEIQYKLKPLVDSALKKVKATLRNAWHLFRM